MSTKTKQSIALAPATGIKLMDTPEIETTCIGDTTIPCQKNTACAVSGYYLERIAYLENLVKKYKFDNLTGLMMKADFNDAFVRMFEEFQFSDRMFSMAIIDIDGLHNVNRQKGYHAGDKLIRSVGDQLQQLFDFNQVYRISGDEFVVIARDCTIAHSEFEAKLQQLVSATYYMDSAAEYTSPSHMFKTIDKKLSAKKAKNKTAARV